MRILIGCERSGVVRDAFRALGHDAYQNFDYGLPIIAFFNKEKTMKYKKDRSNRVSQIKKW